MRTEIRGRLTECAVRVDIAAVAAAVAGVVAAAVGHFDFALFLLVKFCKKKHNKP